MSNRGKGQRRERWAGELYERAGYEEFRPQESKFGETDAFGLFDVIVLGDGRPRFSQVKSNNASGIRDHFRAVHDRFPDAEAEFDFLVVHSGHGGPNPTPRRWRLFGPSGDGGYELLVDERDEDTPAGGDGVVEYLSNR